MNKLIAKRDLRHGNRRIKAGDAFEASPIDTEYYMNYGFAEAAEGAEIEAPTRRSNTYNRRDMQAENTTSMTAAGKNEALAREQLNAQQNAQQAARRRSARAMSTQTAGALTDGQPPDTAIVQQAPAQTQTDAAVNSGGSIGQENPAAPTQVVAPVAPDQQPAGARPSGGATAPVSTSATGTAAGKSNA